MATTETCSMIFASRCLLVSSLLLLLGCGGPTSSTKSTQNARGRPVQEDYLETATDLLRKGAELARCQEAVRQLNSYLGEKAGERAKILEGRDDPALLQKEYGLTQDELDFIGSSSFLPLDAHHLEQCFLLRDVADALRLNALPPLQQADLVLAWVTRNVALDTSTFTMAPAQFVLRRGRGSPEERALLFLGLLHQLDLPGCMISVPGEKEGGSKFWCPGVLVEGKEKGQPQIYLFDMRLGVPIPGPEGKGVATLAQVKAQPRLLAALGDDGRTKYDIGPDQLARTEVYLAMGLTAFAPRMKWLEGMVNQRDHVRLSAAGNQLHQLVKKAAGGSVKVWNTALTANGPLVNSALRCLRYFLPPEEGGLDRLGLQREWQRRLIPIPAVVQQYQALGVYDRLGLEARSQLLLITSQLFLQYSIAAQDLLVRGRLEEIPGPLVRLRTELRQFEEGTANRTVEAAERKTWVERAIQANLARNRKEPGGAERFNLLWVEDQYLAALCRGENLEQMQGGRPRRGPLGTLVLTATADLLEADALSLLALCWLEKAQRLEARLVQQRAAGSKDLGSLQRDAERAWVNPLDWLKRSNERLPLQVSSLTNRIRPLQQAWQLADLEQGLGLWEVLLWDVERGAQLRLLLGDSLLRQGNRDQAREIFRRLGDELIALLDAPELADLVKFSRQRTAELPPPSNQVRRILLDQTLAPLTSTLPWLLRTARYREKTVAHSQQ